MRVSSVAFPLSSVAVWGVPSYVCTGGMAEWPRKIKERPRKTPFLGAVLGGSVPPIQAGGGFRASGAPSEALFDMLYHNKTTSGIPRRRLLCSYNMLWGCCLLFVAYPTPRCRLYTSLHTFTRNIY